LASVRVEAQVEAKVQGESVGRRGGDVEGGDGSQSSAKVEGGVEGEQHQSQCLGAWTAEI
jgi:hypothetical protein